MGRGVAEEISTFLIMNDPRVTDMTSIGFASKHDKGAFWYLPGTTGQCRIGVVFLDLPYASILSPVTYIHGDLKSLSSQACRICISLFVFVKYQ